MSKIILYLLIFYICFNIIYCYDDLGVFGKLKSGLKMAGKLLGLDQASGVAELVSKAFGKASKKEDNNGNKNIFSGFWRVLGFDTKKLGAMAINAIIFVAQLISTSLSKAPPSKLERARVLSDKSTLYDWMMKNEKLSEAIKISKDANLPHLINEYIKEKSLDEDSGCIQLLICKSAPFVWAMQKAINTKDNEKIKGKRALFQFIPSLDDIEDNADECEEKHPYCTIPL